MNDLEQSGIDSSVFRLRNGSLGLSLRFSPEALAALTAEIGAGFVSLPRRGAEVGGILAGEMTQEGSEWRVAVDRITPIPIQYQYGPSWRLSAADKHEFQQVANKGGESSRLIGWYRSNTRPEHEPEEADRQISQTFFAAPQSVFLFCEPSADGRIQAKCIIVLPRRIEVAFAFELGRFSRLEAMFHARHDDESDASPSRARPVSLPRAAPVPPAPRPELIPHNLKVAAVAVVATIGAVWYARGHVLTATTARADTLPAASAARPSPSPTPPPGSLGLRADYQEDSLLIGWNRTAPEVAFAASATFRITDGERTRTLNLSSRELQNGSIVYKPKADEVSVELDVTSREGATASQSIRIVGATLQPSPPPKAAPSTPAQAASQTPARAGSQPVARQTAIPTAPRLFQAPPATSPTEPREIPAADAPPITAAPKLTASNLPSLPEALPTFIETRREFHPPEPVRSPQPVLPAGMRIPDYAYDRPLQIQVEVNIGSDGRVTAARLTGESGPYAGLLGPSALNTARVWRFRPATLGGQPVQSTMVLTFRYARPR